MRPLSEGIFASASASLRRWMAASNSPLERIVDSPIRVIPPMASSAASVSNCISSSSARRETSRGRFSRATRRARAVCSVLGSASSPRTDR
eukprot:scaffold178262_cov27-Tisochrysis_lutea.AAC.2